METHMTLVTDMEQPPVEGMIRVKMMKNVMQFKTDDIVDCDKDTATVLCRVTELNDGTKIIKICKAISLEMADELEAIRAANPQHLTMGERNLLGIKNIVQTPPDPEFEKSLKIIREAAAEEQEKKGDMMAVKGKKSKKKQVN